jgi:hypothetical protein
MENRIHCSSIAGHLIKKVIFRLKSKIQEEAKIMRMNKTYAFFLLTLLLALTICKPCVYADPSGGGSATVSVANAVHSAAAVTSLSEELSNVMAEYESEESEARKLELLNKAKDLLAKLVEQSNNVESEISILSKKKMDKVYSEKLDRVLSTVLEMRKAAAKKIQAVGPTG